MSGENVEGGPLGRMQKDVSLARLQEQPDCYCGACKMKFNMAKVWDQYNADLIEAMRNDTKRPAGGCPNCGDLDNALPLGG